MTAQTSRSRRWLFRVAATFVACALVVIAFGYSEDIRDPVVRRAQLFDAAWPRNVPQMSILLMSDLHVQGPDMPPERLGRIVRQVNDLHPDIVVIAGDYDTSQPLATKSYSVDVAVAPLRQLKPRIGTFAVLGNHDRDDRDETRAALRRNGVTVLENDAVQVGPIALGGAHNKARRTVRRLLRLQGMRVIFAHSPDLFPRVPREIPLTLAGHTHCGQMVLPWIGALSTGSRFGTRYMCGLVRENGKTLIVTAGVGASRVPLRVGAPPDMWLITIGGSK